MSNGGGAAAHLLLSDYRTYTLEEQLITSIKVILMVIIIGYIFFRKETTNTKEE